jgi:hypothetical protein
MQDLINIFLMTGFLFLCLRLGKFLEKVAK